MSHLCTRTVFAMYMPTGRGRDLLVLPSESVRPWHSQSHQACYHGPGNSSAVVLCSMGRLWCAVAYTPALVSPQVLRQQMEVVQSQMQRLQAHREQEGSASEAAPGSSAQHAASSSTHVRAVPQPAAPAGTSSGAQPSGSPPAAGRGPAQPAGGQGSNSSSSAADEVRQRRLQHFNTRE